MKSLRKVALLTSAKLRRTTSSKSHVPFDGDDLNHHHDDDDYVGNNKHINDDDIFPVDFDDDQQQQATAAAGFGVAVEVESSGLLESQSSSSMSKTNKGRRSATAAATAALRFKGIRKGLKKQFKKTKQMMIDSSSSSKRNNHVDDTIVKPEAAVVDDNTSTSNSRGDDDGDEEQYVEDSVLSSSSPRNAGTSATTWSGYSPSMDWNDVVESIDNNKVDQVDDTVTLAALAEVTEKDDEDRSVQEVVLLDKSPMDGETATKGLVAPTTITAKDNGDGTTKETEVPSAKETIVNDLKTKNDDENHAGDNNNVNDVSFASEEGEEATINGVLDFLSRQLGGSSSVDASSVNVSMIMDGMDDSSSKATADAIIGFHSESEDTTVARPISLPTRRDQYINDDDAPMPNLEILADLHNMETKVLKIVSTEPTVPVDESTSSKNKAVSPSSPNATVVLPTTNATTPDQVQTREEQEKEVVDDEEKVVADKPRPSVAFDLDDDDDSNDQPTQNEQEGIVEMIEKSTLNAFDDYIFMQPREEDLDISAFEGNGELSFDDENPLTHKGSLFLKQVFSMSSSDEEEDTTVDGCGDESTLGDSDCTGSLFDGVRDSTVDEMNGSFLNDYSLDGGSVDSREQRSVELDVDAAFSGPVHFIKTLGGLRRGDTCPGSPGGETVATIPMCVSLDEECENEVETIFGPKPTVTM